MFTRPFWAKDLWFEMRDAFKILRQGQSRQSHAKIVALAWGKQSTSTNFIVSGCCTRRKLTSRMPSGLPVLVSNTVWRRGAVGSGRPSRIRALISMFDRGRRVRCGSHHKRAVQSWLGTIRRTSERRRSRYGWFDFRLFLQNAGD